VFAHEIPVHTMLMNNCLNSFGIWENFLNNLNITRTEDPESENVSLSNHELFTLGPLSFCIINLDVRIWRTSLPSCPQWTTHSPWQRTRTSCIDNPLTL